VIAARRDVGRAVKKFCDRLFKDLEHELAQVPDSDARSLRRELPGGAQADVFSFKIDHVGKFTIVPLEVAAFPSASAPGPFAGSQVLLGGVVLFWSPAGSGAELGAAFAEVYVKPDDPDFMWAAGGVGVDTGTASATTSAAPWVLRAVQGVTFAHRPLNETSEDSLKGYGAIKPIGFVDPGWTLL
jgi:hypothetical protein